MDECIFCKIINGEIPTKFVYQDEDLVAFRDIKPVAPIHILVVPRRHLEGVQATDERDRNLLGKMILVAKGIAQKNNLEGFKLFFNCGRQGGQIVFHLHLHLLGGWENKDEIKIP